jgi:hypothetical protein
MWNPAQARYGIWNPLLKINLPQRLVGLQNIFRAEISAIHHTLQILTQEFPTEPAYICKNQIQRYQCNAKLRPDILCIQNHPYNVEPPQEPNHALTVQFIEFTYCNDRYSPDKIQEKLISTQA